MAGRSKLRTAVVDVRSLDHFRLRSRLERYLFVQLRAQHGPGNGRHKSPFALLNVGLVHAHDGKTALETHLGRRRPMGAAANGTQRDSSPEAYFLGELPSGGYYPGTAEALQQQGEAAVAAGEAVGAVGVVAVVGFNAGARGF